MPSIQIQIQELSLQEKIRIRLFNNHLSQSLHPAKVEVIYAEYDPFFFPKAMVKLVKLTVS